MATGSISCYCIFFLVVFAASGASTDCPENCNGHGPPIRFPFRLKNSHPDCGYPGFDLSCTIRNETVLELPFSVKLFVSKIDYRSQKLLTYNPNHCPPKHLPLLNLSTSPFQFEYKHLVDFTVFSCYGEESSPWSEYDMSCLDNDQDHHIVALDSHRSIGNSPSLLSCTKLYNVSSVPYHMFLPKGDLSFSWSTPNCRMCEAERKLCKLTQNSSEPEIECSVNHEDWSGVYSASYFSSFLFLFRKKGQFYYNIPNFQITSVISC